jgi:hypothetical protein
LGNWDKSFADWIGIKKGGLLAAFFVFGGTEKSEHIVSGRRAKKFQGQGAS